MPTPGSVSQLGLKALNETHNQPALLVLSDKDNVSRKFFASAVFVLIAKHFCSTVIASNLLLVDEMMRAGMATLKGMF